MASDLARATGWELPWAEPPEIHSIVNKGNNRETFSLRVRAGSGVPLSCGPRFLPRLDKNPAAHDAASMDVSDYPDSTGVSRQRIFRR